jgi:hypothetical protein
MGDKDLGGLYAADIEQQPGRSSRAWMAEPSNLKRNRPDTPLVEEQNDRYLLQV